MSQQSVGQATVGGQSVTSSSDLVITPTAAGPLTPIAPGGQQGAGGIPGCSSSVVPPEHQRRISFVLQEDIQALNNSQTTLSVQVGRPSDLSPLF